MQSNDPFGQLHDPATFHHQTTPQAPSSASLSNLTRRLLSAAILAPLLVWSIYLPSLLPFAGVVACTATLAAYELMLMMSKESRLMVILAALATGIITIGAAFSTSPEMLLTVTFGTALPVIIFSLFTPQTANQAAKHLAWSVVTLHYIGLPLAALLKLHQLKYGNHWVLLTLMMAWLGDTGAYFIGRFFGKHRLIVRISPNKTIEGSIGGLIGSICGGVIVHFTLLPIFPLNHALLLAPIAGVAGQIGDLCESLLKRSVNQKDSGSLLPGHGGMLDRIDALLFVTIVTWLYASYIAPTC